MNKRYELNKVQRQGRRIFLVDMENAAGQPQLNTATVKNVQKRITRDYNIGFGEMVIIGTSHAHNLVAASAWKGARQVIRQGSDGADRALLEVLQNDSLENRFTEVVLVSGDGIFSEAIRRLRGQGVKVSVDAQAKRLSHKLVPACTVIRFAQPLVDNNTIKYAA